MHNTAPDKVDVEIDLHDGNPPVTKTYNLNDLKPLKPWRDYCATTPDKWTVDVAKSAAHKAVRLGDEADGVYWIKQLYWTNEDGGCNINVWKQLFIYACEDIGLADLTVKTHVLDLYKKRKQHLEELEEIAAICEGDTRHSDLMMIVEAMLICCRAKKSRAADNAIIWFNEHPTYVPPNEEEVKLATKANQPKPVIPEDSPIYDKHTAKGCKMGRGLDYFVKEAAVLTNESNVAGFQAPVTVADPEKTFPTEGGL